MNFQDPAKGSRRYIQLAETLAREIMDGTYKEGQRLKPERDLAAEHEVSRTTIREALLALEIMHYVDIRVGAGVYVLPKQQWSRSDLHRGFVELDVGPHEILEARRTIEGGTAFFAAKNATSEQIADLSENVAQMEASINSEAAFDQADEAFHLGIAEASCNSFLAEFAAKLWSQRRGAMWSKWYDQTRNVAHRRRTIGDHHHILAAIERRRPTAAMTAMQAHIDILIDRFLDLDI